MSLIEHPDHPDFWRHEPPNPHPCWVCGEPTPWVYLDLGFEHPECDWPLCRKPDEHDKGCGCILEWEDPEGDPQS